MVGRWKASLAGRVREMAIVAVDHPGLGALDSKAGQVEYPPFSAIVTGSEKAIEHVGMDRRNFLTATAVGISLGSSSGVGATSSSARWDRSAAERELAVHRITGIEIRKLRDRFPRLIGPNAWASRPTGRGGRYQVRVLTTDRGVSGWAMSHAPPERVEKFYGARVGDLFDLDQGPIDEALPIEKELHDLAGNILGLPVWALLGAEGSRALPIYSGAIYFDDLIPKDEPRGIAAVIAACQDDYDAGYRAFKLKLGRGKRWMPQREGLRRDILVTRAARERFPDCQILVDANDAFTLGQAIEYINAVADCDLYWIEEPFEEDRASLKQLREAMEKARCSAWIADGERRKEQARPPTEFGGYTRAFIDRLLALAEEKLIDVVLLDLGIVGFTRWRKVMPQLEKRGILASPHTWMWTPRPYYTAQLASGVGNVPIVEGIPGKAPGIDYSAFRLEGGRLFVPDTPGFGLTLI